MLKCKNKNYFPLYNLKIYNKYSKYNKTITIIFNNDKFLIFKSNYILLPKLDLIASKSIS